MTLQGIAREWFNKLPAGSIYGFMDMCTKFLLQYQNQRPRKCTHIECHDIVQKPKESLGEFLTRYNNECLRIPDLKPEQSISGLIHASSHNERKDDDDRSRDQNRGNSSHGRYLSGGPIRNDKGRASGGFRNNNQRVINNQNCALLKSLSKTPKEIFATEPVCATFTVPTPLTEFGKQDKTKYCEFHNDHGHDTNRCKNLMERVLEALRAGKLDHLKPPKKDKGKAAEESLKAKMFAW
ncbi:uncharacterized protein [Rutidosis leptorrhynchoides]|uniref:uncharacterized protein n=1 Tax=Rutidosis leptorrhynchoides TaxID=125765 RepID=UPI003A98FDB2